MPGPYAADMPPDEPLHSAGCCAKQESATWGLGTFLDAHAATMPRVMLRYSIEKLDRTTRDHYLRLKP
jgi:hypothetical protein